MQWTEKYRPTTLNEIESHDEIKTLLYNAQETENLPHLLFHGPPGTGKTSMILAYCNSVFSPDLIEHRVLELNASDDRGINVVREQITTFSKIAMNSRGPRYKIIILDEVDAMTSDAQSALRKIIEEYSHITRFCLICNYINKIIDPLLSRCVCFRFLPISIESIANKLNSICEQESISVPDEILRTIIHYSEGDLRKSITLLQNIKYDLLLGDEVEEIIYNNINQMSDDIINSIKHVILDEDVSIEECIQLTKLLLRNGYDDTHIMLTVLDIVIDAEEIEDEDKCIYTCYITEISKRLKIKSDRYVQILGLFNYIHGYNTGIFTREFKDFLI